MTLNDHFTLNFYYYEHRFQKLFYLLTVEPIYRLFLLHHVTTRDVRKRTVICKIFGIAKGLRIFRRRKVAGATSSET